MQAAAAGAGLPFAGVAADAPSLWSGGAGGKRLGDDLDSYRVVSSPPGAPLGEQAVALALQAAHLASRRDGGARPPEAYVAHAQMGSHTRGEVARAGFQGGADELAVLHLEARRGDAALAGALIGKALKDRPDLVALVVTTHLDGRADLHDNWADFPAFVGAALAAAVGLS